MQNKNNCSLEDNKSKLILGTVQFGLNYGVQGNPQPSVEQALDILNHAYNSGINTFDTASNYGNAENILFRFIKQYNKSNNKNIHIISKFKSNTISIESSIKLTLEQLGLESLSGYLLHEPNDLFNSKVVEDLYKLKEKKLTDKIGVSIYTPTQAFKTLEYDFIDIIQVPYNIFDKRLDELNFFEQAKNKNLEIHARSILLQGLLVMNPYDLPKHMIFARDYIIKFRNFCMENDIDPFSAAVSYVLEHKFIDHIIFGVDSIEQLKQYLTIYNNPNLIETRSLFKNFHINSIDKLIMPNLW